MATRVQQVLDDVGTHPDTTAAEIHKRIGASAYEYYAIHRELSRLTREGRLTRTGSGKRGAPFRYRRPGEETPR